MNFDDSLLVYFSHFCKPEAIANLSSTCSELNRRLCANSSFQLIRFRKLWDLQNISTKTISWKLLKKYHFDQEHLWKKLSGFWKTRMTEEYIRAHPLTTFQNLDRLIYLNYTQIKHDRNIVQLMDVPLNILITEMVPEALNFLQTLDTSVNPIIHYFISQQIFGLTLLTRMECIGLILYAEVNGYSVN